MNVFHLLSTLRAKKASSHEIDPEDVFLDSENLSSLDLDQMQGHLERPIGKYVFYFFLFGILLLVGGFTWRLFSMQVIQGDVYAKKLTTTI